jgi:hypothetical protein
MQHIFRFCFSTALLQNREYHAVPSGFKHHKAVVLCWLWVWLKSCKISRMPLIMYSYITYPVCYQVAYHSVRKSFKKRKYHILQKKNHVVLTCFHLQWASGSHFDGSSRLLNSSDSRIENRTSRSRLLPETSITSSGKETETLGSAWRLPSPAPFAFTDRCRCSPEDGIGKGSTTAGAESRGALPLLSPFRSHPEVIGDDGGRKSSRQASRQPPRIHTSGIDRGRTPASTPPRTNDGHTRDEQRGKNEIMYALLVNGRFTYKETTDKIKELGHAWPWEFSGVP